MKACIRPTGTQEQMYSPVHCRVPAGAWFDTFGDEQLRTDKLGLHEVVLEKVDPTTGDLGLGKIIPLSPALRASRGYDTHPAGACLLSAAG
jgi:hypothetical protein